MGLLNLFSGGDDADSQANMAAAMALLQAGGPSLRPTSFGQALGGAMAAGQGAAQNFKDRQMAEQFRKLQMEHMALTGEGMGLDIATKKRAAAQDEALKRGLMNFSKQQAAGTAQVPQDQGMYEEMSQLGVAPTQAMPPQQAMGGATQSAGGFNKSSPIQAQISKFYKQADFIEQTEGVSGEAFRKQAIELMGKLPRVKDWQQVNINGNVMYAPYFDDGTVGEPVPMNVAKELHFQNIGGKTIGVDKFTGNQVAGYQNTQSPDSAASNATAIRGQNMTDARARELNAITREGQQTQVINDPLRGPMLIDKGKGTAKIAVGADGQPIPGETAAKREYGANSLAPILADARTQISKATGSYFGAGYDKAAQAFGAAPGGAQAIAKLKVLEGQIMMSQPRMEGPQSDKDVAMYRQMAGQIGDPTVPTSLKMSALDEIEKLNSRYAKQPAQPTMRSAIKGQVMDGYRFKGGDPAIQSNWEKM